MRKMILGAILCAFMLSMYACTPKAGCYATKGKIGYGSK